MKVSTLFQRASWNLVDQVISSGTNAGLSILIARSVDQSAFGSFAVAFTVYGFMVGVSRELNTSPLGVRFTMVPRNEFLDAAGSAVGAALSLGLLSGAACAGTGWIIGGPTGTAMIALGAVMPALLVQDAWRLVFFAEGRPAAAALNDFAWAVVQVAAVLALVYTDTATVGPLVLAWGGAAAAAALLGLRQARTIPQPQKTTKWIKEHRSLSGVLLVEFVTVQGCQQAVLLLVGAIASLEAIGALRGGQLLLGPITILQVAAFSFAVPELSRRKAQLTERGWMLSCLGVSAVVTVLGFIWGGIWLLMPDSIGSAVLGDTWEGTKDVLWPMVMAQLAGNLGHGTAAGFIGMDRAKTSLLLNSIFGPVNLVLGVLGGYLAGAEGAAWGFAAAFWLLLPFWWLLLRRDIRTTVARNVVTSGS